MDELSVLFPVAPARGHLHIIVQPPPFFGACAFLCSFYRLFTNSIPINLCASQNGTLSLGVLLFAIQPCYCWLLVRYQTSHLCSSVYHRNSPLVVLADLLIVDDPMAPPACQCSCLWYRLLLRPYIIHQIPLSPTEVNPVLIVSGLSLQKCSLFNHYRRFRAMEPTVRHSSGPV